jgi:hypothetical protein
MLEAIHVSGRAYHALCSCPCRARVRHESAAAGRAPRCSALPPPSSHARSIDSSRYEDSIVEDEEPFVDSPVDDADDVRDSIGPDADRSGVLSTSRTAPHARQASELGFEEIMGGEGAVLHVRTVSESGPLPALKAAPGPPPKNMVLVDNVPQRLYGRMRCVLCSATLYICTSRVTCRSFSLPSTPHPAPRTPHPAPLTRRCIAHSLRALCWPGRRRLFCPITSFPTMCGVCTRSVSGISFDFLRVYNDRTRCTHSK